MEDANRMYYKILTKALELPGAKVNRADFLRKNLIHDCSNEQIAKAVNTSVINAEIPEEVIENIARGIIKDHTIKVTGSSTLAGMPGGLAMVATIPADLAQYYYHVIVLAQKLAFLYGYPQFNDIDYDEDDELVHHLTLFIGVMYDVDGADKAVLAVSRNNTDTVSKVPIEALTETGYYILRKNIARWVGIKITKKTLTQGISKVIPIVSGFVSGGVSYVSFTPMAEKLNSTLTEGYKLRLNGFQEGE